MQGYFRKLLLGSVLVAAVFLVGCTVTEEAEQSGQVSGTLKSIGEGEITILTDEGETKTYETAEYLCSCHSGVVGDAHSQVLEVSTDPLTHFPEGTPLALSLENGSSLVTSISTSFGENPHENLT